MNNGELDQMLKKGCNGLGKTAYPGKGNDYKNHVCSMKDGLWYDRFGFEPYEVYVITREYESQIGIIQTGELTDLGLKKYLIMYDLDNKPNEYNTRQVYSEGIDFNKMLEEENYANMVILLLEENRLSEKSKIAEACLSEGTYIGYVAKDSNNKYRKTMKEQKSMQVLVSRSENKIKAGIAQQNLNMANQRIEEMDRVSRAQKAIDGLSELELKAYIEAINEKLAEIANQKGYK